MDDYIAWKTWLEDGVVPDDVIRQELIMSIVEQNDDLFDLFFGYYVEKNDPELFFTAITSANEPVVALLLESATPDDQSYGLYLCLNTQRRRDVLFNLLLSIKIEPLEEMLRPIDAVIVLLLRSGVWVEQYFRIGDVNVIKPYFLQCGIWHKNFDLISILRSWKEERQHHLKEIEEMIHDQLGMHVSTALIDIIEQARCGSETER